MLSGPVTYSGKIYTGDFSASGKSQLLIVESAGTWKVNVFEPAGSGKWTTIAGTGKPPVPEWNSAQFTTGISVGSFLPDKGDQLLSVSRSKTGNRLSYTIYRLNKASLTFESFYRKNNAGKTVGIDTLKPEDQFMALKAVGGSLPAILRYNRDWRFDLKEIRFNDSTFSIISNIDFQGFEQNHNPKYYESLRLVPGISAGQSGPALLLIGKNAADRHYEKTLPDFIHVYHCTSEK